MFILDWIDENLDAQMAGIGGAILIVVIIATLGVLGVFN